jgi:hypothetical protein
MDSKISGCHSCKNSRKQVKTKTTKVVFKGFTCGAIKKIKRDQKITYKIPPKELFTHADPGPG